MTRYKNLRAQVLASLPKPVCLWKSGCRKKPGSPGISAPWGDGRFVLQGTPASSPRACRAELGLGRTLGRLAKRPWSQAAPAEACPQAPTAATPPSHRMAPRCHRVMPSQAPAQLEKPAVHVGGAAQSWRGSEPSPRPGPAMGPNTAQGTACPDPGSGDEGRTRQPCL